MAVSSPAGSAYSVNGNEPVAVWDFSQTYFAPTLTHTRAGGGYGYNASGHLVLAGTDELRYDARGDLLTAVLEPQRTNALVRARAVLGTGWSVSGASAVNLSASALGTFAGCEVSSGGATWNRLQHSTRPDVVSGTTYRMTMWLAHGTSNAGRAVMRHNVTGAETQVYFLGETAHIGGQSAGGVANVSLNALGVDQVYELGFDFTPNYDGDLNFGFGPNSTVAGENVVLYAAQMEQGAQTTSFLDSVGSPFTREADVVTWNAPLGTYDMRIVFGDNTVQDQTAVAITGGWQPSALPFAPAQVLLFPVGTL